MRTARLVTALTLGLLLAGQPLLAGDDKASALQEARMEGQLWATYALNGHLNPFDLKISVDDDTATIEGRVDEDVKKDLAEQIALSVNGIERVKNRIEVHEQAPASSPWAEDDNDQRSFGERVRDATLTATVKSKLIWNQNVAARAIEVRTENAVVHLEGEADSEASRELAERLAANTDGVEDVINDIQVIRVQHARVH